jgi:CBS domain-containing protein
MTDITTAAATPVSLLIGAEVAEIPPTADLHQVCQTLAAAGVGLLVVSDGDGDKVEGVVSERDVVQAIAEQRDPATTRARDIAHATLVWCDTDATVAEVAEQMMEAYVRHVLVEEDGALVGVISARDLLGNYVTADGDPG